MFVPKYLALQNQFKTSDKGVPNAEQLLVIFVSRNVSAHLGHSRLL
jgi:hypothetical protein